MSIATYGDVVFLTSANLVRTWSTFSRKGQAKIAVHDVIGQKEVLEYLGPGIDQIEISAKFNADLGVHPEQEINRLRQLRDAGVSQKLIVGEKPVGNFIIENIDEEWTRVDNKGLLLAASVSLTLKEDAYADTT
ncbi:MAG: phage tail protein [Desulfobacteraceae bacterium]|nr:phage tail protein [Desulfobacteraceae bacterium]